MRWPSFDHSTGWKKLRFIVSVDGGRIESRMTPGWEARGWEGEERGREAGARGDTTYKEGREVGGREWVGGA